MIRYNVRRFEHKGLCYNWRRPFVVETSYHTSLSTSTLKFMLSNIRSRSELPQVPQQLVPTIGDVEVLALTLDTVQVNVTVSDDGGQPELEYTVRDIMQCGY